MFSRVKKYFLSTLVFAANVGLVLVAFMTIKNKEEAKKSIEGQNVDEQEKTTQSEEIFPEKPLSEENESGAALPSEGLPAETVLPKSAPKSLPVQPVVPPPPSKKESSAKTKTS
ncbi:MAG: hypothetical protein QG620_840 [Patescibacteria group bacterium]|nr:hypothetical protein [Patescibacteria group bacterium]